MDLHQQSGPNHSQQQPYCSHTQYQQLKTQYLTTGLTYKSNQILHKISYIKGYPYAILIDIVKLFHMNQFEVIFFSHILNDQECCYQSDPSIFQTNMNMPDLVRIYNRLTNNGEKNIRIIREVVKVQLQEEEEDQEGYNQLQGGDVSDYWTLKELKKLYVYLLVIGYSVKYYLNQTTKVYQDEMKRKYPQFFTTIFNIWVDKYSNKVLRTNPRKINQFYIDMFQTQQTTQIDNTQIDCQYRNYNQIVEELIKATSDADQVGVIHEEEKDYIQN